LVAADFKDEILRKLDSLDQEFFAYPDNLTVLLFAFLSRHPGEIGTCLLQMMPRELPASDY